MNSIFQLEIEGIEDDKSRVIIKVGDVELVSEQTFNATELAELQKHIAFCNQKFNRIQ